MGVLRKGIEFLFILLVIALLVFNQLVIYGIQQGVGQFKILYQSVPVRKVLNDINYPDSVKQKIILIEEIKKFAVDSLGLSESDNYTTFYNQEGKPVLWVITASEAFELKPKEWWFPLIGSVSYKGFFKKHRALDLKNELLQAGYDVDLGTVSAWSTLGFFNDPILSNMLNKSEGDLANLIIHELTHGTIYAKSSVDFNENLASFIGDKGALLFLKHKYGSESEQLNDYLQSEADDKIYNEYMLENINRLDTFYNTMRNVNNDEIKNSKKDSIISQIIEGVNNLLLSDKEFYYRISKRALISKNAFFLNFEMYDSQQDKFERELKEKGKSNLKNYIAYLKQKYGK